MRLEFTRTKNNKVVYILGSLIFVCFILAWILPIGIDKVTVLPYREYLFSLYTVFTQFGFLIFSFIFSYSVTKDYTEKNILFYKLMGTNSFSYFLKKSAIFCIESSIILTLLITLICIFYQDFSAFFQILYLIEMILIQYILIINVISIYGKTPVISVAICIGVWLVSIICVGFGSPWNLFAFFDASNNFYDVVRKYLLSNNSFLDMSYNLQVTIFILILTSITLLGARFAQKEWLKSGVK